MIFSLQTIEHIRTYVTCHFCLSSARFWWNAVVFNCCCSFSYMFFVWNAFFLLALVIAQHKSKNFDAWQKAVCTFHIRISVQKLFREERNAHTNRIQCIVISHLLHAYYFFIFFSPFSLSFFFFFLFFASFIMFGIGCNIGISHYYVFCVRIFLSLCVCARVCFGITCGWWHLV